jgi:hypothetical protein
VSPNSTLLSALAAGARTTAPAANSTAVNISCENGVRDLKTLPSAGAINAPALHLGHLLGLRKPLLTIMSSLSSVPNSMYDLMIARTGAHGPPNLCLQWVVEIRSKNSIAMREEIPGSPGKKGDYPWPSRVSNKLVPGSGHPGSQEAGG